MIESRSATAAALVAAVVVLAAPAVPAQERQAVGKVEVAVQVKGGGAVPASTLYLGRQRVELPAGTTSHLFQDVPVARSRALTGEARSGGKRLLGVEPVAVVKNRVTKATLTFEEAPDAEVFCSRCHPGNPDDVGEGEILRDRHVSGKVLEGKYLPPVEKYNAAVEKLLKEGKPHNEPIILEKRVVLEGGKKVERPFFTCESCHTLHWDRGEQKYARAQFKKQGDLCRGCHP